MAPSTSSTPTTASDSETGVTHTEAVSSTSPMTSISQASGSYILIRLLFRFVLRVFYSNVVVEGAHFIPKDGIPCVLVSNHSNSLTDALLLVTTVPSTKRQLLRLTAKDTQFNRGTFTSWLIESAGTLPIQRPKDHLGRQVDNSVVFAKLIESLERGDMICMFPEGLSRYYPLLSPLKQGVARIVSDVLSRQKSQNHPNFELAIQTCSITYLHRNLFRSDVLVTFHPPLLVTPESHPGLVGTPSTVADYEAVRKLTSEMGAQIRNGTLDSPTWGNIRVGNTARRLYAPLGTKLGLGDHVRLTQRFIDVFSNGKRAEKAYESGSDAKLSLKTPMIQREASTEYFGEVDGGIVGGGIKVVPSSREELENLAKDLKTYQDLLCLHGVKDDRVRNPRMLRQSTLWKRLFVRMVGAIFLFVISIPGLCLWVPIFLVAKKQSEKQKRTGPIFDTYDEVAQTKLVYGLISGILVYLLSLLLTLPILPLSIPLIPIIMWITLRWLEDLTSSLRAALALTRLLLLGKGQLILLKEMRAGLEQRVEEVAVRDCGLPRDSRVYLEEKKRWSKGSLLHAGFFSLNRRRKKDWNEALKLSDQSEYPEDDLITQEGGVPKSAVS